MTTYKREFEVACNQISIELLKSLDDFLNKNILPENIEYSSARFECDSFELNGKILPEILENEKFITNFNNNFSIYLSIRNTNPYSRFTIIILKKAGIRIFGFIENIKEDIVIGQKEIIGRFIKEKFVRNELTIQQTATPAKTSSVSIIKKNLSWKIPAIKLALQDFIDLENLIRQDFNDVCKYKILASPTQKYIHKQQNAPQYSFGSITEFKAQTQLLNNINNYSIKFLVSADDIEINLSFTNEDWSRALNVSGKNQTLYYGKYMLLKDYLTTKKTWYSCIYGPLFTNFLPVMLLTILSYSIMVISYNIAKGDYIQGIKYILFLIISSLFIFLTPKILHKNNFEFSKTSNNQLTNIFQYLWSAIGTIILGLFINIITPHFQNLLNKISNILFNK